MEICIQNLGKYNEGELWFEWVELSVTDQELAKVFDKIHICHDDVEYTDECGCPYEEYMLADWEDIPSGVSIGEYSSIDYLNEVAEFFEDLDSEQEEVFNALLDEGYDFDDAKEKIETNDCIYYEASNDYELAEQVIENEYGNIDYLPREVLERYFDYDSYGADLSYDYTQTDNGYVRF